MDTILHCFRRNCLVNEDDQDSNHSTDTPQHFHIDRNVAALSSINFYEPPLPSRSEEDEHTNNDHDADRSHVRKPTAFVNFLQNIGKPEDGQNDSNNSNNREEDYLLASPLREAKSSLLATLGSHDNIPTIALSEVVLPGSQLQRTMSLAMKNQGYTGESEEDECVICMEGFDDTNPRMPTLCGCGANKTYFHLPCLYHWIEQSQDCPSCRKPLAWQEF